MICSSLNSAVDGLTTSGLPEWSESDVRILETSIIQIYSTKLKLSNAFCIDPSLFQETLIFLWELQLFIYFKQFGEAISIYANKH